MYRKRTLFASIVAIWESQMVSGIKKAKIETLCSVFKDGDEKTQVYVNYYFYLTRGQLKLRKEWQIRGKIGHFSVGCFKKPPSEGKTTPMARALSQPAGHFFGTVANLKSF